MNNIIAITISNDSKFNACMLFMRRYACILFMRRYACMLFMRSVPVLQEEAAFSYRPDL